MKLGAFSISLSVKDIEVSRVFYEKLGFSVFAGSAEHNYYILKNGDALIGVFQGMFQGNILTFNPGWDQSAQLVPDFDDIRSIQQSLMKSGLEIDNPLDETQNGPASIIISDPDGNTILLDQHVSK
ncbi:MAG: VOC family protein [Lewinellaceae bacterium]|nr:VOC family protein [Lewinellaceae bacterium]